MTEKEAREMLELTRNGYNTIAPDWHSTRLTFWSELLDTIKDYIQPHTKVIDIGCGNGRLYKELQILELDYTGVDTSEKLLELAKSDFPSADFKLTNGIRLDFKDGIFDQALSIAVLHHIPPALVRDWLKEIHRILKPNTTSIFTTWNLAKSNYSLNNGDAVIGFMHYKNVRYVHHYTYEEIQSIFTDTGFRIREIQDISRESGMTNTVIIVEK